MCVQDGQHLAFPLDTAGIRKIQIDHTTNLLQAQPELFEGINFVQPCQRLFRVVMKAPPLALALTKESQALVIANRPRRDTCTLGQLANSHFCIHRKCSTVDITVSLVWYCGRLELSSMADQKMRRGRCALGVAVQPPSLLALLPDDLRGREFAILKLIGFEAPAPRGGGGNDDIGSGTKHAVALNELGRTVDFDAAWLPRLNRFEIVDHERYFGIAGRDVFILAGPRKIAPANIETAAVKLKAHCIHIDLAIRCHRSQASKWLGFQKREF